MLFSITADLYETYDDSAEVYPVRLKVRNRLCGFQFGYEAHFRCEFPDAGPGAGRADPGAARATGLSPRHRRVLDRFGVDAASYARAMTISKGDKVLWNTSQGETTGEAVEKKTEDFTFKGQDFKPTGDDPFWIVKSEKSGSEAAHKESALTKA